MEQVTEILKYVLPSVVTFLAAWFVLKTFLENEQKKRLLELRMKSSETTLPVRLQAYERLLLLLERISIHNLLVRTSMAGASAQELHLHLVTTVRQEFDHNVAQQLYVSKEAWELIRSAKEEVLKVVNTSFAKLPEASTSQEFLESIMEAYVRLKPPMTAKAIDFLKKEALKYF